jgi:microsomal dipeptidase-like Zn-dependent dipeptidase
MKTTNFIAVCTLSFLWVGCQTPSETIEEVAQTIHEQVITLDTHVDINTANFTADRNYTQDLPTQVTIPKMIEGGLDVAWLIVYTGQGELTQQGYADAYANAIDKFDAIQRLAEEYAPDQVAIATTSEEVRSIVADGKLALMIGIENGYPVATNIERVEEFYNRGGRYMSLSHNGHNQLSDSNTGERDGVYIHGGVSEFGKEVIEEMNRLGMIIDLSHPSKEANLQTMSLSKAPVIASHSSARALSDVSRNMDDEQLLALKENGGVIQTVAFRSYVDVEKHMAWREAQNDTTISSESAPPVNVSDLVDHIDYLVELIGIDHVGISSDFDGGGGVDGWMDASETYNVTLELVKRGYSQEEIEQLWSGNLLRVLDEVQAVAMQLQMEE